jgi:hypothetical protein
MRLRLIAAVVALVLAGCGEETADEPSAERPTTREQREESAADREDARIRRQLRRYFKQNFGGAYGPGSKTTWYGNIKTFDVSAGDVTVETDVYPDADAEAVAQPICTAIITAALPEDDPTIEGITGARVLDGGDGLIKRCESPAF